MSDNCISSRKEKSYLISISEEYFSATLYLVFSDEIEQSLNLENLLINKHLFKTFGNGYVY